MVHLRSRTIGSCVGAPTSFGVSHVVAIVGFIMAIVVVWSGTGCKGNGPESRFRDVRQIVVDSDLFVHLQEYHQAADFLLNVAEATTPH